MISKRSRAGVGAALVSAAALAAIAGPLAVSAQAQPATTAAAASTVRLVSKSTGLAMSASFDDKVTQRTISNSSQQKWLAIGPGHPKAPPSLPGGYVIFKNVASGECLDTRTGSFNVKSFDQQLTKGACDGTTGQQWRRISPLGSMVNRLSELLGKPHSATVIGKVSGQVKLEPTFAGDKDQLFSAPLA